MAQNQPNACENPLGTRPTAQLIAEFSVPSIIAMLVSSLYNIVDQFFIGRSVGELGNAATNIAFPLTICCIAIALMFGIGGASAFNISMGEGDKEKAAGYMGTAAFMMVACATALLVITQLFLRPLLLLFGSPLTVLPYALQYTRITAFGLPFLVLTSGGGHLVRADGRPRIAMVCNLAGAVVNTVLDALFVFGFHWGIAGAAVATVIGQALTGLMIVHYLRRCRTVTLNRKTLTPTRENIARVASLGAAPCSNQLAMLAVQVALNNSLKHYGAASVYGEEIPIACAGIITKVWQVFFSFIIGLSQGAQPTLSYNYGARQFGRVKQAYCQEAVVGFGLSILAFLLFQLFPGPIISIFGKGSSELYVQFAERYFRVYLFFAFANFMQPLTSNCFTAIGKPKRGMFLSLTRQVLFLLPLMLILPLFMGMDGILYSAPIADGMALVVSIIMLISEFTRPEYRSTAK